MCNKYWRAMALGLGVWLFASHGAEAAFVFTMEEVACGVELTGSGTINTAALTIGDGNGFGAAGVLPNEGVVRGGNGSFDLTEWFGVTGPASFGPGASNINTSARSGDPLVIIGIYGFLLLPDDYVSGSQLSNTGFFGGSTFASLGVTPGTYVWGWGREDQADSLTLQIVESTTVPVPEPASAAIFGSFLLCLAAWQRRAGWHRNSFRWAQSRRLK